METQFLKRKKNQSFCEVLAFATEELHNHFIQLYNNGHVNNEIDSIIIDEIEKQEFFKSINANPVSCYSVITMKYSSK